MDCTGSSDRCRQQQQPVIPVNSNLVVLVDESDYSSKCEPSLPHEDSVNPRKPQSVELALEAKDKRSSLKNKTSPSEEDPSGNNCTKKFRADNMSDKNSDDTNVSGISSLCSQLSSTMFDNLLKLIEQDITVEYPAMPSVMEFSEKALDYTVQKMLWWYTQIHSSGDPPKKPVYFPELLEMDNKSYEGVTWDESEGVEDDSLFDSDEAFAVEFSKTSEQFDGFGLLEAKLRVYGSADRYAYVLERIGSSPTCDDVFPAVRCALCQTLIKDKVEMKSHMYQDEHRRNMLGLSLHDKRKDQPHSYLLDEPLFDFGCDIKCSLKCEKDTPGLSGRDFDMHDSQGRLHHERITDTLTPNDIANYNILEDTCQRRAKLELRGAGCWDDNLQSVWTEMVEEETRLLKEYRQKQKFYIANPSRHPEYTTHWEIYWKSTQHKLSHHNLNSESCDLKPGWKKYWAHKLLELLKTEYEGKISKMKKEKGMDVDSLKRLCKRPQPHGSRSQTHSWRLPGSRATPQLNLRPVFNRYGGSNNNSLLPSPSIFPNPPSLTAQLPMPYFSSVPLTPVVSPPPRMQFDNPFVSNPVYNNVNPAQYRLPWNWENYDNWNNSG